MEKVFNSLKLFAWKNQKGDELNIYLNVIKCELCKFNF